MLKYFLLLLIIPVSALSQSKFEIPQLGFSVEPPTDWITAGRDSLDYADASLKDFENLFKNEQTVVSYYDTHVARPFPTLDISVKHKEVSNGGQLMSYAFIVEEGFKKQRTNYRTQSMSTLEIGKNKGVVLSSVHDVTDNQGKTVTEYSILLILAKGKFLITLEFQGADPEANKQVFQAVRQTITLAEPTTGN